MEERKPELHDKRDRLQGPSRDSCFAETQIGRFREQTICESLRASGGNAGGGSENIVFGIRLEHYAEQTGDGCEERSLLPVLHIENKGGV